MRWLLCLLLLSCGGGGGVQNAPAVVITPPEIQYNVRDFWPTAQNRVTSIWTSAITGPDTFKLTWGTDEEFRIAPNPADGGKLWLWLDAYSAPGVYLVSHAERTEIDRGAGWQTVTTDAHSTPYLPILIGQAGVTVRSWGSIEQNGIPIRRWFHSHRVSFAPAVLNTCWTGTDSTKDTLLQTEFWWDNAAGWSDRGAGPIDPNTREPTGEGVSRYKHHVAQGPRGGPAWKVTNETTGYQACISF